MSVERDSPCMHFWAHAWKTFDQYTRCLTCGERMTPAKEDYTDHDVWGRAGEANDEARSQLTDAEHDPRDF